MKRLPKSLHLVGNALLACLLVLLWLLATPSFKFDTRYTPEGEYPGDANSWLIRGDSNNATLEHNSAVVSPTTPKFTSFAKRYGINRSSVVTQYVRIEGVVVGTPWTGEQHSKHDKPSDNGSLFSAWFENTDGERIEIQRIAKLDNSASRQEYHAILAVPRQAVDIRIGLILRQFDFKYSLSALKIEQLELSTRYKIGLGIAVFVGLVLLFVFIRSLLQKGQAVLVLTFTAIVVLMVVGLLLPGGLLPKLIYQLLELVPFWNSEVTVSSISKVQSMGHFFGFLVLAPLALMVSRLAGYQPRQALITILLFVVFTEIIQRHSVQRSPSIEDIMVDIAGLVVGGLLWFWFNRERKNELA